MGATNFVQAMEGYDSPRDAYDEAVKDAIYCYGNNPYSGTIATTSGFEYLGVIPEEDVENFIENHTDNYDKWSKCGCIESKGKYIFFGWVAI